MQNLARRFLPLKRVSLPSLFVRNYATAWNKDWKPGPYPQTPEERAIAAKKYGMIPEDYEVFPDDGLAPGDYPAVQPLYEGNRSPWELYDLYPERRNFGEPLNWNHEVYRDGWYDPDEVLVTHAGRSYKYMMFWACVPVTILFILTAIGERFKYFAPRKQKQYPFEGNQGSHYTFDRPT